MLTADLALSWRRGKTIRPHALDVTDPSLEATAADLLAIVRVNVGGPRSALDRELDEYIGAGTDYRVLRGLIKLILDRCEFETQSPVDPAAIRREVFTRARERHPVDPAGDDRTAVIHAVAEAHALRAVDVEAALYADLSDNQRLVTFDEQDPVELLERYNLAQAQALLYRSVKMELTVEPQPAEAYRRLFDAIKAYRLIHRIEGSGSGGYVVTLDGPVSLFHRSQKYGVQMAVFLPALLACEGWRMRAEIDARPKGRAVYELDARTTKLRPPEERLPLPRPAAVEKLLGGLLRAGVEWQIEPCRAVVDLGGSAFVPDAEAVHEDGRRVFVEVLGFWTPKYVADRAAELIRGGAGPFLLAASEELLATRDGAVPEHPNLVVFKSSLDAKVLRAALDRVAGVAG
jgi:predicted nuclease of restriction endonuclease-like RecB superfamily